jgi:uncharacterized protein YjdB
MRKLLLSLAVVASTGCSLMIDPGGVKLAETKTLTAVTVSPASATVPKGATQQLTATAAYSDGSSADVTAQAAWSTSAGAVATVSTDGLVTAKAASLTATVTAAFGGRSGSTVITAGPAVIVTVTLSPASLVLGTNATLNVKAFASYTDGTLTEVTASSTWSSDNAAVAAAADDVGMKGLVTTFSATGSATVTAAYSGKSGTAAVTVTTATVVSIAVAPATATVAKGSTRQLTATATMTSGPPVDVTGQATWSSAASGVAGVSDAAGTKGLVTGAAASGTAVITAAFGGQSGTATITAAPAALVSIAVTPQSPTIGVGGSQQLTATGTYTDGSSAPVTAAWSSSDAGVVTVTSGGLANGAAAGMATVTASYQSKTAETVITVSAAAPTVSSIAVTPATPSVGLGGTVQMTATATYSDSSQIDVTDQATWTTGIGSVATVSNAAGTRGLVSAVGAGSTSVNAAFGGKTGNTLVTVKSVASVVITGAPATLPKGATAQLTATANFSGGGSADVTASATWASNAAGTISVTSPGGLAKAEAATGGATITATYGGVGGTAAISAVAAAVASIQVAPATATVPKGATQAMTATATLTDGTTNAPVTVTWSTSAPSVFAIDPTTGVATAAAASGSATITATHAASGKTGTATLTADVKAVASISITGAPGALPNGLTTQLSAWAVYTDSTTDPVTSLAAWSSDATATAIVSNPVSGSGGGVVTAKASSGSATISAAHAGKTGTFVVTVTDPEISSVTLSQTTASLPVGSHLALVATGNFTDGTNQNLTASAGWSSADPTKATVGGSATSAGVVRALAVGGPVNVTATATIAGVTRSATCAVTVTPVAVARLDLYVAPIGEKAPPAVQYTTSLPVTTSPYQGVATATYTDGRVLDVTRLASWSSANPAILSVSNAVATRGQVTTVANGGPVNLTATFAGMPATIAVTIRSPMIVYVAPFPGAMEMPMGATGQMKPMVIWDDFTFDASIAASAFTWTSSNNSVATVGSTTGVVTPTGIGSALIRATHNGTGLWGEAAVIVVSASVTPVAFWVYPSGTISVDYPRGSSPHAFLDFSDGTTWDVTGATAWAITPASPDMTIAPDGNITPVAGHTSGTANVTATYPGFPVVTRTATIQINYRDWDMVSPGTMPTGQSTQVRAWARTDDGTLYDVTSAVSWSSSTPAVATIDGSGKITTLAVAGSTNINGQLNGNQRSSWMNVVTNNVQSLTLTPGSAVSAPLGYQMKFDATIKFGGASPPPDVSVGDFVILSSDNAGVVAPVAGSPGTVLTKAAGLANVTGTLWGVTSAAVPVNVVSTAISSIAVTPGVGTGNVGAGTPFTATATMADNSVIDVTRLASWWAVDPNVAYTRTVQPWVFYGQAIGTTQVGAGLGSVAAMARFDVGAAVAQGIQVAGEGDWPNGCCYSPPGIPSVPIYGKQQLRAWANLSDGTHVDVTELATWSPTTGGFAGLVSDTSGSKGTVTGFASGSVTVTATYQGLSGSGFVSVYSTGATAAPTSGAITPAAISAPMGGNASLRLTGNLVPAGTVDLTAAATWTSSNPNVVSVSNVSGTKGVLFAWGPVGQSATITATYPGLTIASVTATVSTPVVSSIGLRWYQYPDQSMRGTACDVGNSGSNNVPRKYDVQLHACATYTGGRTYDVTQLATWSPTSGTVGTVSNVNDVANNIAKGQFQSLNTGGSVTPTATLAGVTSGSSAIFTVSTTDTLVALIDDGGPGLSHAGADDVMGIGRISARALYSNGNDGRVTAFAKVTALDPAVATTGPLLPYGDLELVGLAAGTARFTVDYRGEQYEHITKVDGNPYLALRAGLGDLPFDNWNGGTPSPPLTWPTIPVGISTAPWLLGIDVIGLSWGANEQATWSSSNPAIATVSNAAGTRGLITGVAPGYVTVTATLGGFSASVDLFVSGATLSSLSVSPTYDVAPIGVDLLPFTATATYSDGSTYDVTALATWGTAGYAARTGSGTYKANLAGLGPVTASFGGSNATFRIGAF